MHAPSTGAGAVSRALGDRYREVRETTERLCSPLELEDYVVQSMPDASPTKWHLAHTTWFFERFVLARIDPLARPFHPRGDFLWNSYYESVGPRHARAARGLLSRPTVAEVFAYRRSVDERMQDLLERALPPELVDVVELGINHEQQHQELLLTDLKHVLSRNPIAPVYREAGPPPRLEPAPLAWTRFSAGASRIGHIGDGFSFDNERPRHEVVLEPFELANRLVTAGEYLLFMEQGGYRRPELWLSDGWAARAELGWEAPLYWEREESGFLVFTLSGKRRLVPGEPVSHVSFYEADAFARWSGTRLPREQEWEVAARACEVSGNLLESGALEPRAAPAGGEGLLQIFGDCWEWTESPYVGYPGFRPAAGPLGEYNGKFMCNQVVLRGGSWATPRSHIRATYRNFFPPAARWQVSGIRLARDVA